MKFLPIILGTDVNAYGIARSIHMAYGIKSLCVGQGALPMTKHSKIVDIKVVSDLMNETVFADALVDVFKEQLKEVDKLILFAASDGYAELVIDHQEKLAPYCELPFVSKELKDQVILKEKFYQLCEEVGLTYPKTVEVRPDTYKDVAIPFDFPVAVKPSNSVTYAVVDFPGKKKAYILENQTELDEVLQAVYTSDYQETMLIQDFIPGSDSHMRVLNAYVGKDGKVQMMSLGQPFLEDVTPELIGNYVAIESTFNQEIYDTYKTFLEKIDYKGFANFDMKYDARHGTYNIFEINLRPGRSSFYTTLAGCNLIEQAIKDLIFNETVTETVYGDETFLWLGAPEEVVVTYTEDDKLKEVATTLIHEGKVGYTLLYDEDKSLRRNISMKKYYGSYTERYEKWFKRKEF